MSPKAPGDDDPTVLLHYRGDYEPFGRSVGSPPAPVTSRELDVGLAAARRHRRGIVLERPLVNPDARIARALARAVRRGGGEGRIRRARWRAAPPYETAIADLLRRVDEVEVELPSASRRARRYYRDPPTFREVVRGVAWLRREQIEPVLSLWVGVPGEDEIDLLETLRRAYSLEPKRVRLEAITAPSGSFFHQHRKRLRLDIESEPPFRVRSHRWANPFELRWFVQMAAKSVNSYNYWSSLAGRGGEEKRSGRA